MSKHSKVTKRGKHLFNGVVFLLLISIWAGVIYFGYNYVKAYIDIKLDTAIEKLDQVQDINSDNFEVVNTKVVALNNKIDDLKNSIEDLEDELDDIEDDLDTIDSLSEDDSNIKNELEKKLEILNNKLYELDKSLKILKEAPNVEN